MLYLKGNVKTPLLSAIGGRVKYTNSHEFILGQEWTNEEYSSVNDIAVAETASLTAPDATAVGTTQKTNCITAFQETIAISDMKRSNSGALAGANLANQVANPANYLDLQVANKMNKIARGIENLFINGTKNVPADDTEKWQTGGLVSSITTNTLALSGKPLDIFAVNDILTSMGNNGADLTDLTLLVDGVTLNQINASAIEFGVEMGQVYGTSFGINVRDLVLPQGTIHLMRGEFLPAGTALVINLNYISPVEQPIPGKGNFYLEELARVGAGEKYQIFGQIGLDYGAEFLHGKITGIATTFTKPLGKKVVTVASV